ncbi:PB1 domain-containing protein [Artemisia annua]|uniref:PB1 domain-containing protein n=1 Tax=Artemisia annua TaxID=35608 RepID=A0A2U1L8R0_ARTAN|nr:PB1 domain-containing protein [Artemisia annua]
MAKGKLILICHFGGDFVTNGEGNMSYNGGEANAVNVTGEMPFNDLKLQVAEACDVDQKTINMKYFLPLNKKNLIVIKNDKDVKRLLDFHVDAYTAEVFITGTPGFDRSALPKQPNRESDSRKDKTLNHDNKLNKNDKAAKRGRSQTKKDDKVSAIPPFVSQGKRTRSATAAAKAAEAASINNQEASADMSDGVKSAGAASETSLSASDHAYDNVDSGSSSDYRPRRSAYQRKRNSHDEIDVTTSPADTSKKRNRTPTWKFGANGRPTIISIPDSYSMGSKSQGKRGKTIAESSGGGTSQKRGRELTAFGDSSIETRSGTKRRTIPVDDDSDHELDNYPGNESDFEQDLPPTTVDGYMLPETTVDARNSAITGVGQEFKNVNEFRAAMKEYSIANRFGYKLKKNDLVRASGVCAAEGCTWSIYASWVPAKQLFVIKKMNNVHTCTRESRISSFPAKNWLVGTIKERLQKSPDVTPKNLAKELSEDFGVKLSYTKVWRGIGGAREQLHGSPKESYNKLPWFCEKLVATNPGSVANLVIGDKKRFKSLFVSFYALIRGFQNSCRPLIFLEATSLKSRYGEILLTANAIDGNESYFPVAFAIVAVEDEENWHWFLEQLKTSILNSQPITFVVDIDKNLKKSILSVFEDAHVGYSIYHLLTSFNRNIKIPFHGDSRPYLTTQLLEAAQAIRPSLFKKSLENIKRTSSQAYDWVMQTEPEHWAASSFKGERYNYISEDVGVSYARLIEEYQHSPILEKIDALVRRIIDDVEVAKLDASMWTTQLTALKEKELEKEKVRAYGLKVLISSDTVFEVREDLTHVVNVSNWSCTCMRWKETGLPCRHAIAVFSSTGKNLYDFCSGYFTASSYRLTYAESIHPLPPPEKQKSENQEKMKKKEGCIQVSGMEGTNMDEGENTEVQTEEGANNGNEKDEVIIVNVEKDEGTNIDEGENTEVQTEEGANNGNEKDEVIIVNVEKDEGTNADAENVEGNKLDAEKDKVGSLEAKKDEGGNVDAEKEEGSKLDVEKKEGSKSDTEKDEVKIVKLKEEHEDPNVFVLPPRDARQYSSMVKEKTDVEKEGKKKRIIKCTKCNQMGHYTRSCKT